MFVTDSFPKYSTLEYGLKVNEDYIGKIILKVDDFHKKVEMVQFKPYTFGIGITTEQYLEGVETSYQVRKALDKRVTDVDTIIDKLNNNSNIKLRKID